MSLSTNITLKTRTSHINPKKELESVVSNEWDAFKVVSVSVFKTDKGTTTTFELTIFELSEEESRDIRKAIQKEAAANGFEIEYVSVR